MADDKIVISAIARVVDLATGPLKAIQGTIAGVTATAAKTTEAMAGVGAAVGGVAGRLGEATGKVGGFARSMAGMFGPIQGLIGLAGLGGLTANIVDFIDKSKEITRAAARFNLSTDSVQTFYRALGGAEQAEAGLTKLMKALTIVNKGGAAAQPLISVLTKMGVSAKELKEGNLEAILPKIMEGFKQNTNPVLRAQAAIALFGRSGQSLIPFLIKGKAGLDAFKEAAKELNKTQEDLAAGVEAGKAMKELGERVEAVKSSIAAAILPAFVPMVKALGSWIIANKALLRQVALPAFIGLITTSLISLGVAVAGVLGPWALLIGALVAGGVAIYQNWGSIISWLDKEVPGLTTTVAQAARDLGSWASRSVDAVSQGFKTGGVGGGVVAIWNVFKTAGIDTFNFLVNFFGGIDWAGVGRSAAQMLGAAMMALWQAEIQLGEFIIQQVSAAWDGIKAIDWAGVGKTIGTLFGQAILLELNAIWDFTVWSARLGQQLVTALAGVDWGQLAVKVTLVMMDLVKTMTKIGFDLIGGLIAGMIDAIPGLRKVTDGIANFFTSTIPNAAKQAADGVKGIATNVGASANTMFTGGATPYNPLLFGPGVGPLPAKVESNTRIQVLLPPGATANTSTEQTGGRPAEVNVGPSATVMP